ncbi:hypothetical protein [Corynebacterium mastitidis]|uniref:hypothetical protein n=1 Tax=Corynebacterium mastitidis TaxID=161890 RepID=UPI00035E9DB2|nr:hypothetical protein [Corynebacterium mastitidis]
MTRNLCACVASLCGLVLAACTIGEVDPAGEAGSTAPAPQTASSHPAAPTDSEESSEGASGAAALPVLSAPPGTAVVLAGESGVASAGELEEGPAWSTSKIPLAIAALRAFPEDAQVAADVRAAIRVSDNEAAARLWAALGSPEEAGRAVQRVLADGGDERTRVETRVLRPGLSSFGQTAWSLEDQAAFARALPGLAGAGPVLDAMGEVAPEQSYGLGAVEGMRFKGGWGPDEEGRYTARQVGVKETPCGIVAVALAARPSDGSYESAQRLLTEAARALPPRLGCA